MREVFLIALCCAVATQTYAAEDCSKALVLRTQSYSYDEVTKLSIGWTLSEDAYNKERDKYGINAVVYAVPMGADYSKFRENLQKRFEELNIQDYQHRAYSYATSGLDPESSGNYKDCLRKNRAPDAFTSSISKINYVITIIFNPLGTPNYTWSLGKTTNVQNTNGPGGLGSKIAKIGKGSVDREFTIIPVDKQQEASVEIVLSSVWSRALNFPPLTSAPTETKKIRITQLLFDGKPATLKYDQRLCTKFPPATRGTLECGVDYTIQYNNKTNEWSVTRVRDNFKAVYSNTPATPGIISMWGHFSYVDDKGTVTEAGVPVGLVTVVP